MSNQVDLRYQEALNRFNIIAPLLDPHSEKAFGRIYRAQICENAAISPRTLRRWLQAYRKDGLEGLYTKERSDKGSSRALSIEALELACELRKELPERSAERLCELLEHKGHRAKRSTLERQLRLHGHSGRVLKRERKTGNTLGRRFQHSQRNSLWQTDFKYGPLIPDPQNPGKKQRTYLLAFIDDCSRKIIYAEFYLEQSTTSLIDGLRKAILSSGCPRAIYLDQGKQFISTLMQLSCARLGIRHLKTKPYSPESKGKVERLFKTVDEFILEVQLEQPQTLYELNIRLQQWVSEGYNRRIHSSLEGKSPGEAFAASTAPLRMVTMETLSNAFLWEEERTVDKSGCIKLNGILFDTGLNLPRKKVIVQYDPLDLSQVEIFYQGVSRGHVKPIQIGEFNGVARKQGKEGKTETQATTSAVLKMMAEKEQHRIRGSVGAFILSKEGNSNV